MTEYVETHLAKAEELPERADTHAQFRLTLGLLLVHLSVQYRINFCAQHIRLRLIRTLGILATDNTCVKVNELMELHFPNNTRSVLTVHLFYNSMPT